MMAPTVHMPAGSEVGVVRLEGNRRTPEPTHFRVVLPFGEVDIARVNGDDGQALAYWVHVSPRTDDQARDSNQPAGRFAAGRVDVKGKHASECDAGDFNNPDAYHVAIRLEAKEAKR